jgi:hypothetical protein
MITCHKMYLEDRCRERGYSLEEVMPCVVSREGDDWTIDVDHPAYPRTPRPGFESAVAAMAQPPETKGPGTEMKKLLAKIGITSSPDCQCNARARYMDEQGPEWCEQNMAEIIGWLREEAEKRKLPFVDFAGRLLVKKAIANARKNGQ